MSGSDALHVFATLYCLHILQPTVFILYSLQSKAIYIGSVPGTTTLSCQSATSNLDATLLLYAVFIDLNTFWLSLWYVFMIASLYFSHACFLVILLFVLLLYFDFRWGFD